MIGKQQTDKKVVVVWIDGGTFDVITPILENGKLPTFAKIINGGASGALLSTIPPITPTAWASLATGVNPGKHGVYDFWEVEKNNMSVVNSYSIRRETIWSMLNKANKKVVLLNAPLTYPPRKVKGLLVTGLMTPSLVPHTFPEHFRKKLLKEISEYRVYTQTNPWMDKYLYLEEAYTLLKARCEATLYLMENYDWDLFFLDFFYTDQIQHFFWKYMDTSHPAHDPNAPRLLKEAIQKAYKTVDDSLHKILETIGEDATLIIMSDHGFGPMYKIAYINNYLLKIGLVKMGMGGTIKRSIKGLLRTLFQASRIDMEHIPDVLKYVQDASKIIFGSPFKKRQIFDESSGSAYLSEFLDSTQTKAYSMGSSGQIFVNREVVKSTKGYESVIKYLIQKLHELRDPETDEKMVDTVFKRSEIYSGPHVNSAPDLTLVMRNMSYVVSRFIADQITHRTRESTGSGCHRMEGILIMYGEDVRPGCFLKECRIMDLAPTILYLMGIPFPSDMDGKALVNAFRSPYVKAHPVRTRKATQKLGVPERYAFQEEEEEGIRERLKALGYM